jgi:transposase
MSDVVDESAASSSKGHRRFWSVDLKRQIVAESFAPDASVAIVARHHGINANLLFTWRRRFGAESSIRREEPVKMIPVAIAAENSPAVLPPSSGDSGRMEIVLAAGERIIVGADVETAALARVLKVLQRR